MSWQGQVLCTPNPCECAVNEVTLSEIGVLHEWRVDAAAWVTAVRGRYRQAGDSAFKAMEPFRPPGAAWTAECDASDFSLRGLEYYLLLDAPQGFHGCFGDSLQPERLPLRGSAVMPSIPAETIRMISTPFLCDQRADLWTLLRERFGPSGPTSWQMGRWDPGLEAYRMVEAQHPQGFLPGEAYWIGFAGTQASWSLSGETNFPPPEVGGSFELTLQPGWNMVGNPAGYAVSLDRRRLAIRDGSQQYRYDEAAADPLRLVAGEIYIYKPELPDTLLFYPYDLAPERLEVWGGCWAQNLTTREIDLLVPAQSAASGAATKDLRPSPQPATSWSLALWIRSGLERTGLELGIAEGAHDGLDRWDAPLPPPVPGRALEGAFLADLPNEADRSIHLLRDVRAAGSDTTCWLLEIRSPAAPCELTWDPLARTAGPGAGSAGLYILLATVDGNRSWDMRALESIELPPGAHLLEIRMDSASHPPARSVGPDLSIEPNPFLGATVLRYEMPATGTAFLELFDLSGSRVWNLRQERRPAGTHVVLWDGRTDTGTNAPAGTYFLRVQRAGSRTTPQASTSTIKIVKLR